MHMPTSITCDEEGGREQGKSVSDYSRIGNRCRIKKGLAVKQPEPESVTLSSRFRVDAYATTYPS